MTGSREGLGYDKRSGSKEEGIFFSFHTTQPRKKETQAKTSEKTKEKERAKNQAVTLDDFFSLFDLQYNVLLDVLGVLFDVIFFCGAFVEI